MAATHRCQAIDGSDETKSPDAVKGQSWSIVFSTENRRKNWRIQSRVSYHEIGGGKKRDKYMHSKRGTEG